MCVRHSRIGKQYKISSAFSREKKRARAARPSVRRGDLSLSLLCWDCAIPVVLITMGKQLLKLGAFLSRSSSDINHSINPLLCVVRRRGRVRQSRTDARVDHGVARCGASHRSLVFFLRFVSFRRWTTRVSLLPTAPRSRGIESSGVDRVCSSRVGGRSRRGRGNE